ncbi:MAG: DNA-directed RNA polymerase subunit omega [candidate division Zixibacteria bacterium]|nr:DNA-directed RNA polymerase subunit omega [candidate division Zixibacteria bacterium]
MSYQKLDRLDEKIGNRYEAAIIAAKRARQINADRLAKLELMPEDADIDRSPRKVTAIALEELMEGKLKIEHE